MSSSNCCFLTCIQVLLTKLRFGCLLLKSQYLRVECWLEEEKLLHSRVWQPAEKVNLCSKTSCEDSKWRRNTIWGRGSKSLLSSPVCRLVSSELAWWCSRNLVFSMKLPSSAWVGTLVPAEFKGSLYTYITLPHDFTIVSWLLLLCFCILSHPHKHLFESDLWNLGKVSEAEWNLYPTNKNQGHRKDLYFGGPHYVLLFQIPTLFYLFKKMLITSL